MMENRKSWQLYETLHMDYLQALEDGCFIEAKALQDARDVYFCRWLDVLDASVLETLEPLNEASDDFEVVEVL